MKTLLILSLGALLIGSLYVLRPRSDDPAPVTVTAPVRSVTARTNSGVSVATNRSVAPETIPSPWAALEAGDFATFVARLRAAGCPEETVRVFTVAALGRHYQERVSRPARERTRNTPWWREPDWTEFDSRREQTAQKTARAEFQDGLTRLLGTSGLSLLVEFSPFNQGTTPSWLSYEQQTALSRTKDRFQHALDDILERAPLAAGNPLLTQDQRDAVRQLRQQERDEIRSVLGAAAFARYEAEQSPESRYAKASLPEANSEADFLLMVQAAREVGVEDFDRRADLLARSPGFGIPGEPQTPSLRDRVLARYQELAGPDRAVELEVQMAYEDIQAAEAKERQREIAAENDLRALATAGGVEITTEEYRAFKSAIEAKGKELEAQLGKLSDIPPENRAEVEAYVLSEMERVAVATMGPKGRVIIEQMKLRDLPQRSAGETP